MKIFISIVILLTSISLKSQSLMSKLDTVLYSSVNMLKNTLEFDQKAKCSYAVVRILSSSKKRRIDFNITYEGQRCMVENIYPDYHLVYNDTVKILIVNDSKLAFDFPMPLCKEDYMCSKADEFQIEPARLKMYPVVYNYSISWLSKGRRMKVKYKYEPYNEISYKNRPIKTYYGIPNQLIIDTANHQQDDRFIRSLHYSYYAVHDTILPDSLYTKMTDSFFIIKLDE